MNDDNKNITGGGTYTVFRIYEELTLIEDLAEDQEILGTYKKFWVVAETIVYDETAFHAKKLVAKVPLLSYFVRLWC